MIVLSLLLVIVAAVLLVLGIFNSSGLGLIYGSIGACVAAMVLLGIGVLQRRRSGEPATADGGGYGPGAETAGGEAPVVRPGSGDGDEAATVVTAGSGGAPDTSGDAAADAAAESGSEVVAAGHDVSPTPGAEQAGSDDEAAEVMPKTTAGEAAEAAVGVPSEPTVDREPAPEADVDAEEAVTAATGDGVSATPDADVRAVLAGISGVGPAKQEALLDRFDSVEELESASVDELTEVRGFGESLAASVKEQLEAGAADREVLADLRGVGSAKQQALLDHFGSVDAIRAASVEELAEVKGFGNRLARSVRTQLGGDEPATTGAEAEEVLAEVKGIGPAKRRALLDRFESVEAIRDAPVDELTEVKGLGESLAESVRQQLS